MKIRQGFVSNSSSSSFVIHKGFLTEKQIVSIFDYERIAKEYLKINPIPMQGYYDYGDEPEFDFSYLDTRWSLKDYDDYIFGETSMDNFSFGDFFRFIGVDVNIIDWDEGYISEPTDSQKSFIKRETKRLRKKKLKKINEN